VQFKRVLMSCLEILRTHRENWKCLISVFSKKMYPAIEGLSSLLSSTPL